MPLPSSQLQQIQDQLKRSQSWLQEIQAQMQSGQSPSTLSLCHPPYRLNLLATRFYQKWEPFIPHHKERWCREDVNLLRL